MVVFEDFHMVANRGIGADFETTVVQWGAWIDSLRTKVVGSRIWTPNPPVYGVNRVRACDARKSVLEDGFFSMDDSVVGEHVLEMQQKDLPFTSKYGLEFCKLNVLDDTVSIGGKCSYGY
jgi:hypothetical protein